MKLKSSFHLSENQAQNAICTVANTLFGRSTYGAWKPNSTNEISAQNTLPSPSNTVHKEAFTETFILSEIVEEIMGSDDKTVVVYSNDGSAQKGVGKFVVQSFLIGEKRRTLPTMSIISETKESLSELQEFTYKMLCAASDKKYEPDQILNKVDFYVSDSARHNLGVMEKVCDKLSVSKVPDALLCHVHPMMMFQRKVKELWKDIHNSFGTMRIRECFIADVNFGNEPFISKALSCLCAFINSDFSEKPWNRQLDFDTFISPKKNESLSLKDHRFNRVSDCCTNILYHLDDISRFLDIHKGIVNGLAVLDRTFIDMEVLKSLFCASSLIGIHFANPFLVLLLRKKTTYETLLESYPKLYEDLNMQVGESFLQTERRIVSFVEDTTFTESLPKSHLRENVAAISSQYKDDVLTILKNLLHVLQKVFPLKEQLFLGLAH